MSFPPVLLQADFVMVRLTLELLDACRLDPWALLGLRRGLICSGRALYGRDADLWFEPPLSSDPQALKRFQKPSPAFVFCPQRLQPTSREAGDTLDLSLVFVGSGLQQINAILKSLRGVGQAGLLGDGARFEIVATDCLDASGAWRPLRPASRGGEITPAVLSVGWWLDALLPAQTQLSLIFSTPTRLVAHGEPLRRPHFQQLFPFMLRRVTSMLYYHCGLEPVEDLDLLQRMARSVEGAWQSTRWIDWQDGRGEGARLGGLTGEMRLAGTGLEELMWILCLSSLLGIGRGAPYGAGRFEIVSQ